MLQCNGCSVIEKQVLPCGAVYTLCDAFPVLCDAVPVMHDAITVLWCCVMLSSGLSSPDTV
jgi:hypothetical protein